MKHLFAPACSQRILTTSRGRDLPLTHPATQNGTPRNAAAFGASPFNTSPMTNQLQLPPPCPHHTLTAPRGRDLPLTHHATQNGTPCYAAAFGASPFNTSPMTNQLQLPPPSCHHILTAPRGRDLPLAHHTTQNGTPRYAAALGASPFNLSPMTNQLQLPPPYSHRTLTASRGRDLSLTHQATQNGTPRNAAALGESPFNLSPMTNQLQLPLPCSYHALTVSRGRDLPLALKPVKTAHPFTRPRWGHRPLTLETSELWTIAAVPDLAMTTTCATLPASIDEIRCSPLYCWPSRTHPDRPGLLHEGDTSRFYPRLKRYQRRYQGGTERYQQAVPGDTRRYPHPEKAVPAQYHPIRRYRPGIAFSPVPPGRYPVPLFKQGDTEAIRAASTARIGIASIITPLPANAAKRMNRADPVQWHQSAAQRPDAADGETGHAAALRSYLLPVTWLGKNNNQEELLPDYLPT